MGFGVVLTLAACGAGPTLQDEVARSVTADQRYHPSTADERGQVVDAVQALHLGERPQLPAGYLEVEVDAAGEQVPVIVDRQGSGGVYAVRPDTDTGLVIQVPHPLTDLHTEDVGVDLFAATDAQALLVAGAARDSGDTSTAAGRSTADVAHNPDTVFAAVNDRLAGPHSVVVQLHGFSPDNHPGYGDVVVSGGQADAGPTARRVAQQLRAAGYQVCLYDGDRCARLGGTRNVQGRQVRERGGEFVHLEIATELRTDPAARARLTDVLADALR